jgi:hypothetical protein
MRTRTSARDERLVPRVGEIGSFDRAGLDSAQSNRSGSNFQDDEIVSIADGKCAVAISRPEEILRAQQNWIVHQLDHVT